MTQPTDSVADLVRDVEAAAAAFIRGDMPAYVSLIRHADDYTLMPPFGGEVRHGFDASEPALEATAAFFQGGEARLEVVALHTSGDLTVLVALERQHGRVGGLPDQELSLRVTLIFRRRDDGWELVHRHADPLVHPIGLPEFAALARGSSNGASGGTSG